MLYERALHLGNTLRSEIPTPLLKLPRFTFNRCRFRTTELMVHRYARGSHIDVACTSICDRDQNVHQAINVLFRSQSRDQDESSNQEPQKGVIKRSGMIFTDQDS